jgi:hypothetical protein
MTDSDRDGLKFQTAVCNTAARQWMNRKGWYQPPSRQILSLLHAFIEEKWEAAVAEGDWRQALEAMCDLRVVLNDLVSFGHPQFAETLAGIDADLVKIRKIGRDQLLARYLDAPTEERAEELKGMLIDLAAGGYWDSLLEDMDEELSRREMGIRERAC